jgi:hypothetical protein
METLVSFFIGVLSSLVAAYFLGFKKFKKVIDEHERRIAKIINPVNDFNDIGGFITLFDESIDSFDKDFSQLVLYRALPCEITDAFIKNIGNQQIKIVNYQNTINSIIKESDGSFDKSIFGKTGIAELDNETRNIIISHYYSNATPPDTTDLGLHDNLDESGVILIGKAENTNTIGSLIWEAGFLIIYSSDFKKIRGFRLNLPEHIRNIALIFEQKQEDSKKKSTYWEFSKSMSNSIYEESKVNVDNFYK